MVSFLEQQMAQQGFTPTPTVPPPAPAPPPPPPEPTSAPKPASKPKPATTSVPLPPLPGGFVGEQIEQQLDSYTVPTPAPSPSSVPSPTPTKEPVIPPLPSGFVGEQIEQQFAPSPTPTLPVLEQDFNKYLKSREPEKPILPPLPSGFVGEQIEQQFTPPTPSPAPIFAPPSIPREEPSLPPLPSGFVGQQIEKQFIPPPSPIYKPPTKTIGPSIPKQVVSPPPAPITMPVLPTGPIGADIKRRITPPDYGPVRELPPVKLFGVTPELKGSLEDTFFKQTRVGRDIRGSPTLSPEIQSAINIAPKVYTDRGKRDWAYEKKKVVKDVTKSDYIQTSQDQMKNLEQTIDNYNIAYNEIRLDNDYIVTTLSGKETVMSGKKYRELLKTDMNKLNTSYLQSQKIYQDSLTKVKDWHPDTKITRTTYPDGKVDYDVKFPYAGAENYGTYYKQLQKGGVGGLFATALTGDDPLGITSAFYTATGEKQKAIDTKIKALHSVKNIKSPWDALGWYASMPTTQIVAAYLGGSAIGKGLAWTTKIAPRAAIAAKGGLAVYGVGAGIGEGSELYTMATTGKGGEAAGRLGTFGLSLYAGVKGYKSGYQKGTTAAYRKISKSWIKYEGHKSKYNALWNAIDQSQKGKIALKSKPKIVSISELDIQAFKDNPKQVEAVTKWILQNQGKYKIQIGGSAAMKVQMISKETSPHDLDITVIKKVIPRPFLYKEFDFKETIPTKIRKWTGIGEPKYKGKVVKTTKIGWTRDVSPKARTELMKTMELKSYKDFKKYFDVHSRGKPGEVIRPGVVQQKPVKIGKFKFMDIKEQVGRKGTSWQNIEHKGRGKDIIDFLNIRKEQVLTKVQKAKLLKTDPKTWPKALQAELAEYYYLKQFEPGIKRGAPLFPEDVLKIPIEKKIFSTKIPAKQTGFEKFLWKHTEQPKFDLPSPYSPPLIDPYIPPTPKSLWYSKVQWLEKHPLFQKLIGKGYDKKLPSYEYLPETTSTGKVELWKVPIKTPVQTYPYPTQPPILPSYGTGVATAPKSKVYSMPEYKEFSVPEYKDFSIPEYSVYKPVKPVIYKPPPTEYKPSIPTEYEPPIIDYKPIPPTDYKPVSPTYKPPVDYKPPIEYKPPLSTEYELSPPTEYKPILPIEYRPPPPPSIEYKPLPPADYKPPVPVEYKPLPPSDYRPPPTGYEPLPPSDYMPPPPFDYKPPPPTDYKPPPPPVDYKPPPPYDYSILTAMPLPTTGFILPLRKKEKKEPVRKKLKPIDFGYMEHEYDIPVIWQVPKPQKMEFVSFGSKQKKQKKTKKKEIDAFIRF